MLRYSTPQPRQQQQRCSHVGTPPTRHMRHLGQLPATHISPRTVAGTSSRRNSIAAQATTTIDASNPGGGSSSSSSSSSNVTYYTCRRCRQQFTAAENNRHSCRFHPQLYSGGEVAKAVGFVRQSAAPEHQLQAVMGRRGLIRFWDCCGSEDESAPGCCSSHHITYDEQFNEEMGWDACE